MFRVFIVLIAHFGNFHKGQEVNILITAFLGYSEGNTHGERTT
ncbi:rCG23693 [Rattus norvegicus]|uniref:RCG23693 n=1 Tax=Rattus norvegicus TaxID=10116 RepID=A6KT05_RAT|nr:rCG23693 [Rattus norvegicus]